MNNGSQDAWNIDDSKFAKYLSGAYTGFDVKFKFSQTPQNTTAQQYVPVYFTSSVDAYNNVTAQAYIAHVWECFM